MFDEFEREKLVTSLKWLVYGIWAIGIGIWPVLILIQVFDFDIFPQSRSYIVAMAIMAVVVNTINTKLFLFRHQPLSNRGLRVLLTSNMFVIQIFITMVVSMTGGIESPASHLFHFVTVFTILSFSARAVVLFAIVSDALLNAMYVLEYYQIIPHFYRFEDVSVGVFGHFEPTLLNVIATSLWLLAIAIFGSFVGHVIKRREEQIFSERHRVAVIIHDLPDGILLLDPSNRLIFMNPSAENIISVSAEQALNRVFRPDQRETGFERLYDLVFTLPSQENNESAALGMPASFEYMIGDKDRERYFQVTPLNVQERDSSPLGRMIIIHDITREKLLDKLKSEFISVAAHQLRTPLTAIKWALQMLRDGDTGPLNPEQHQMLEKGYISNQRMVNLVNDLLDVSRIEEGRFRYELRKVSLDELIKSLLKEFEHAITERKIHLSVDIPAMKLPYVYGDESKLRMVFQNLIDNAIRYTKPEGAIQISLRYSPEIGMIGFLIKDNGVGIPAEAQPHIFSKFFRGENVVRLQTEGSGLGLFIAKNIVEQHHGKLTFKSEEGKGTEFVVTLPSYTHWQDYQSKPPVV